MCCSSADQHVRAKRRKMASTWIFIAVSFFINIFAWLFAALLETEVFYDLVGGITYLTIGCFSYWFRAKLFMDDVVSVRQYWATLMLVSWAVRLSGFLFVRALIHGDRRLSKYKNDPLAFLIPFSLQAVWCITNALPVLLINASGAEVKVGSLWDSLTFYLWCAGHLIEIVADVQKWLFRSRRENKARFISTGLWAFSRHPNYFGQIVLQWSLMLFCLPAIWSGNGWFTLVCAVASPAFETWLLLRVSGVPLLEKEAKAKWGDDPSYRRYTESVSLLVPMLPKAMPGASKRKFYSDSSSA